MKLLLLLANLLMLLQAKPYVKPGVVTDIQTDLSFVSDHITLYLDLTPVAPTLGALNNISEQLSQLIHQAPTLFPLHLQLIQNKLNLSQRNVRSTKDHLSRFLELADTTREQVHQLSNFHLPVGEVMPLTPFALNESHSYDLVAKVTTLLASFPNTTASSSLGIVANICVLVDDYITYFQNLLVHLAVAHKKRVTPELLPLTQIEDAVRRAKDEFNLFPFFDIEDLHYYYSLITPYFCFNSLVFAIPVRDPITFSHYSLYPFPTTHGNLTISLDLENTHFIMSHNLQYSMSFPSKLLNKCKVFPKILVCTSFGISLNLTHLTSGCLYHYFRPSQSTDRVTEAISYKECQYLRHVDDSSGLSFLQLQHRTFLHVASPRYVTVMCRGKRSSCRVEREAAIDSSCRVYTSSRFLPPRDREPMGVSHMPYNVPCFRLKTEVLDASKLRFVEKMTPDNLHNSIVFILLISIVLLILITGILLLFSAIIYVRNSASDEHEYEFDGDDRVDCSPPPYYITML